MSSAALQVTCKIVKYRNLSPLLRFLLNLITLTLLIVLTWTPTHTINSNVDRHGTPLVLAYCAVIVAGVVNQLEMIRCFYHFDYRACCVCAAKPPKDDVEAARVNEKEEETKPSGEKTSKATTQSRVWSCCTSTPKENNCNFEGVQPVKEKEENSINLLDNNDTKTKTQELNWSPSQSQREETKEPKSTLKQPIGEEEINTCRTVNTAINTEENNGSSIKMTEHAVNCVGNIGNDDVKPQNEAEFSEEISKSIDHTNIQTHLEMTLEETMNIAISKAATALNKEQAYDIHTNQKSDLMMRRHEDKNKPKYTQMEDQFHQNKREKNRQFAFGHN